jgi:hypothetical protein
MEKASPMTAANLNEFLRLMLVDSEARPKAAGDEAPEGFRTWQAMRMSPEDYCIAEWDGRAPTPPFRLPAQENGAAHAVSMTALLYLRRWWKESAGRLTGGEVSPARTMELMGEDLDAVIAMLAGVRDEMSSMAHSDYGELINRTEHKAREARGEAEIHALAAEQLSAEVVRLEHCQDLQNKLMQGPMELLAGAAQAEDSPEDEE